VHVAGEVPARHTIAHVLIGVSISVMSQRQAENRLIRQI
jgi:hypothetical protein